MARQRARARKHHGARGRALGGAAPQQPYDLVDERDVDAGDAAVPSLKLHQNLEWASAKPCGGRSSRLVASRKDAAELMGISQRALSHYLAKYRIE
jgi:hypothetical protein